MPGMIYAYDCTVAAGVTSASPTAFPIPTMPLGVDKIIVSVPPGCHNQVGWRITHGGGQAFPYVAGSWFYGDNIERELPVQSSLDAGSWVLQAFNSGVYSHTLEVIIYTLARAGAVSLLGAQTPAVVVPA